MALSHVVQVENYHADNDIFSAKAFKQILLDMDQHIRFSDVGAYHQNRVAESVVTTDSLIDKIVGSLKIQKTISQLTLVGR